MSLGFRRTHLGLRGAGLGLRGASGGRYQRISLAAHLLLRAGLSINRLLCLRGRLRGDVFGLSHDPPQFADLPIQHTADMRDLGFRVRQARLHFNGIGSSIALSDRRLPRPPLGGT